MKPQFSPGELPGQGHNCPLQPIMKVGCYGVAHSQVLRLSDKPAWLDHNRQPQKAMKVGCCGMARSQVLRLSDKPAWLNHNRQPQKAMKVGCCGMARSQVLRLSDKPAWLNHNRQPQKAMKVGCCGMVRSQVLRLSDKKGFTLIELIVVMALITTMTAFAIPKIRSTLFTNQLRATARQFIGLVAEVGQQARSERKAVVLRFDRKEHVFTTAGESKIVRDKTSRVSSIHVDDSVQIVDIATVHGGKKDLGTLAIRFNHRGYVDKTVVHFRDDDGEELSIIISPFLGVTRVFDGYVTLDDDQFSVSGG